MGLPTHYYGCALAVAGAVILSAQPAPSHQNVDGVIKRYCAGCHNEKLKSGNVSLTGLTAGAVNGHGETWEKVLRKVRTGEMPPPGLPRPDAPVHAATVEWLEGALDKSGAANPTSAEPSVHRLNRAEYGNAVRDLLSLDLDHSASLPVDDASYGFDNIGDVLTVSPIHMEKYMSAARRVSRMAIGTGKASPAVERFNAVRGMGENLDDLPLNTRGAISVKRHFPLDAEYSILVRVRGTPQPELPAPKLDLRLDGKRLKLFDVVINPAEEAQYTRNYELRLPVSAGIHVIGAGFLSEYWKTELGVAAPRRFSTPAPATPASVEYVAIGGPFKPTGPGETETRKKIFVCRPAAGVAEEACAQRIISSLARRAYRRPVQLADIQPLMGLFAMGRKDGGSFDSGVEMALRGILVSPNFLFRVERVPAAVKPGANYRLGDLDLASRLSFFLWSSIPDETLLRLAELGRLKNPAVLEQQVKRMLADPKSKALVGNFAGQWLHLRNVADWRPDGDKFSEFDDSLRAAFTRETELLFSNIMREDRSVLELINADYTYLNERLAKYYQIPGVRGNYFRRVALTSPERGGILTHGSVLTVTSYATRTSPVLRGKWILENVLAAPPPPPPPDVPNLEDSADKSAKNLRQALEKHRANAACASCHSRLDPLGFALENYDSIGRFRKVEDGVEIDASGAMPNGAIVRGPAGLKQILMERKDEFVECFAEKMLIFALGRGLEYSDYPTVREIRRHAASNNYAFSSVALAVAKSLPFQMRRAPGP